MRVKKALMLAISFCFIATWMIAGMAQEVKGKKININTASSEELQALKGIGPAKAEAIIKYREEHGSFDKIEDVKNVKGISDAIFEDIKDSITVGEETSEEQ